MHKNRIIIIFGILIIVFSSGVPSPTRGRLVEALAALIVVFALMIEKKGVFSLQWHKKNPVTPTANTYIEHDGAAQNQNPMSLDASRQQPL